MTSIIDEISCLYNKWAGGSYAKCTPLPRSGSDRQYFRLTTADQQTVMAAYNQNVAENEAYFSFSRAFALLTLLLTVPSETPRRFAASS